MELPREHWYAQPDKSRLTVAVAPRDILPLKD
jgi:hypothetical protein